MWTKLKIYIANHKKGVLIAAPIILIVLFAGAIAAYRYFSQDSSVNVTTGNQQEEEKPVLEPSLLNGVLVSPEIANRRAVVAMIENSMNARPQTGLTSADIVYEAVAEGGITRFMALYSQVYPEKAGPIRSARSNYIDWLSEYDGIYVHAGGSPMSLDRIREYGIKAYSHANDGTYWREPRAGVASEHTLFANLAKILENSVNNRGWSANHDFTSWKFKDPVTNIELGGVLNVNFSSAPFNVRWNYDKATNLYSRVMGGVDHKDALSGEQITAKTIIVMNVNRSANPPYSTGKQSEWTMDTVGSGSAALFFDGKQVRATWKKPSRLERTKFFDDEDKEIAINRGKIWVQVIPQTGSYTFTQEAPAPQTP